MFKKLVLIAVVLVAMFATASPALAHRGGGAPPSYYVDTAYTGTETGTPTQPFNTLEEAIATAQAQPYGGNIYTRGASGVWMYYGYIASVNPPYTGSSLSGTTLFLLLGVASLILVLAGWFLMRRSRAQALPA